MHRPLALSLVVLATLAWTTSLIAAPTWASRSGTAGPTASALIYVAGSFVCHQQPERSFHHGASQLPVCARCLGLYAGATMGVLGWAAAWVRRRHATARTPNRFARVRPGLLLAAVPTVITVSTAWLGLWDPANDVRFALALPLGAAAGVVVAAFAVGDLE
jgi:uncharacterized membrane protein